jgi:dipeptidase
MHVGFGPVRINQTTGSMVSHLHPEHPTHFVTGTAAPCTSVFKPVWVDAGLPDTGETPQGSYNPDGLFWQHERLHRQTLLDYPQRIAAYCGERDALEERLVQPALELAAAAVEDRRAFSAQSFYDASQAESAWLDRVRSLPIRRASGKLYQLAWNGFNRQANMP